MVLQLTNLESDCGCDMKTLKMRAPYKIGIQRYDGTGKRVRATLPATVKTDEPFRITTSGAFPGALNQYSMETAGGVEIYNENIKSNVFGNAWADVIGPATKGFYSIIAKSRLEPFNLYKKSANINLTVAPETPIIPTPPQGEQNDTGINIFSPSPGNSGGIGKTITSVTSNTKWIVLGIGGIFLLSTARKFI